SAEDRLDSSQNNDILPSKSASQIQQVQLKSLDDTQAEGFSTIQTEPSTNLAPFREPPRLSWTNKEERNAIGRLLIQSDKPPLAI
ncbi:hypothetical protein V1504DRAFT_455785, partial [Lipomyces starkeyi]